MKSSRDDDTPWVEGSARQRATADRLLGAAKDFNPAVGLTFADIQTAVRMQRRSGSGLPTRLLAAVAVGACVLLVMGGVALSRGWLGWLERPVEPTLISVPAGATARVERRGRFRLALRGPGAVEIRGDNESLRLEEGNLRLENQAHPVVVEATGRKVEISPSSTVSIELPARGALQVTTSAGTEPLLDGRRLSVGAPAPAARPAVAPAPAAEPIAPATPIAAAPPPAPASPPRAWPATPRPARAVTRPAQSVGTVSPSPAATEVAQIRDALESLRTGRNPAGALGLLDDYDRRFPTGLLHDEVAATRIEALLALGRSTEALERLEAIPQALLDRSPRLRIARGELRANHGRCRDALTDFAALLSTPIGDDIERRANLGRTACLRQR